MVKNYWRKNTVLLCLFLLFIIVLQSCNPKKSPNQNSTIISDEKSASSSIAFISSEVNTSTNSENKKSAIEEMESGDIIVEANPSTSYNQNAEPLAKWYINNILGVKTENIKLNYLLCKINNVTPQFKIYILTYATDSELNSPVNGKYIILLCGEEANSPNSLVLIDGCISTDNLSYPLESNVDKLKRHSVAGKYIDELLKPTECDGMEKIDISQLIGQDRNNIYSFTVSENVIAIISIFNKNSDASTSKLQNCKISYIDIPNKKLVKEIELFTSTTTINGYKIKEYWDFVLKNDTVSVYFQAYKGESIESADSVYCLIKFTVDIKSLSNIETQIVKNDDISIESENSSVLTSKSGRYSTFKKNHNLYVHDSKTNEDSLLFKGYIEENSDGLRDIYVQPAFFVNDVIYYNVIGYEHFDGIGCYDPATKQSHLYKNNMYATLHANGYIYCTTSIYDYFSFNRFKISNPETIEPLIVGAELESSYIFYSKDGKYIIRLSRPIEDETPFYESYTITVYNSSDFTIKNTYSFKSKLDCLSYAVPVGDYLFIHAYGPFNNNIAYVLKLNK